MLILEEKFELRVIISQAFFKALQPTRSTQSATSKLMNWTMWRSDRVWILMVQVDQLVFCVFKCDRVSVGWLYLVAPKAVTRFDSPVLRFKWSLLKELSAVSTILYGHWRPYKTLHPPYTHKHAHTHSGSSGAHSTSSLCTQQKVLCTHTVCVKCQRLANIWRDAKWCRKERLNAK